MAVDTVVRSAWRGKAQSAFVSTVGAVTPDLLLLADGLDAQAAALHSYAGQVQQIKDQQAALALQRSRAHTDMDTALSKLHASHNLDDRVLAQERATGQQVRTDDILRLRARLTERIEAELAMLDGLSVTDLHALLKAHPELASKLARTDPQLVAGWWHGLDGAEGGLSDAQTVLVAGIPTIIGALSGLPALVRIEANRINAATQLARSRKKVARLQEVERIVEALAGHPDKASHDEIRRLTSEIGYLQAVVTGTIQLYLYDPGASRIIEMIGTPSPKTTHVITYVPGTFTNLNAFYANGVQQVGKYLTVGRDDTLAFIYKDGPFPGGDDRPGDANLLRILEANDQKGARSAGKTLAGFQAGLAHDPQLSQCVTVAIGHSWGLANVTASEMSGAHYDKVVSLSGAWMPNGSAAQAETAYSDYSYDDALQIAQRTGIVGDGNYPRADPAFEHGQYYRAPGDMYAYAPGDDEQHQINLLNALPDHNLIASNLDDNQPALLDLRGRVFDR